jgi:integrase
MASVFPRYDRRPIPEGAELLTRKGQRVAKFTDSRGRTRIYPLDGDETAMLVKRRHWYVAYLDATGRRVTKKGYTDREASEQLGRDLERQEERKRAGLLTIDAEKVHAPFLTVVELYVGDLERRGKDPAYRKNEKIWLTILGDQCHWGTPAGIRSDDLVAWLASARKDGLAPRTLNHYIETARRFIKWCIKHHYTDCNPLANIDKADARDTRVVRRALTEQQLRKLLECSPKRWLVYLTAMKTGLRKKELRKLQWGDVVLEGRLPHLRLRVMATKAKRSDTVPIDPELAECLAAARPADARDNDPVFGTVPKRETYQRDLARAGIAYKDDQGRQADFHALRMSYNMLLAQSGAPPRVAQELMRHHTIELTMGAYTDPKLLDLQGAVDKLPRLTATVASTNPDAAAAGATAAPGLKRKG